MTAARADDLALTGFPSITEVTTQHPAHVIDQRLVPANWRSTRSPP